MIAHFQGDGPFQSSTKSFQNQTINLEHVDLSTAPNEVPAIPNSSLVELGESIMSPDDKVRFTDNYSTPLDKIHRIQHPPSPPAQMEIQADEITSDHQVGPPTSLTGEDKSVYDAMQPVRELSSAIILPSADGNCARPEHFEINTAAPTPPVSSEQANTPPVTSANTNLAGSGGDALQSSGSLMSSFTSTYLSSPDQQSLLMANFLNSGGNAGLILSMGGYGFPGQNITSGSSSSSNTHSLMQAGSLPNPIQPTNMQQGSARRSTTDMGRPATLTSSYMPPQSLLQSMRPQHLTSYPGQGTLSFGSIDDVCNSDRNTPFVSLLPTRVQGNSGGIAEEKDRDRDKELFKVDGNLSMSRTSLSRSLSLSIPAIAHAPSGLGSGPGPTQNGSQPLLHPGLSPMSFPSPRSSQMQRSHSGSIVQSSVHTGGDDMRNGDLKLSSGNLGGLNSCVPASLPSLYSQVLRHPRTTPLPMHYHPIYVTRVVAPVVSSLHATVVQRLLRPVGH